LRICRAPLVDDALLLHGRMWAAVGSASADRNRDNGSGSSGSDGSGGSSSLMLEAGLLLGEERCVAARRTFDGDRLAVTAFTAAATQ
jgi:hypothetical protein